MTKAIKRYFISRARVSDVRKFLSLIDQVTGYESSGSVVQVDETSKRILFLLLEIQEKMTVKDVAVRLNITESQAFMKLSTLNRDSLLEYEWFIILES